MLCPGAAQRLREVAFPVDAGALQSEGDQLLLKAGHSGDVRQKYLVTGGETVTYLRFFFFLTVTLFQGCQL